MTRKDSVAPRRWFSGWLAAAALGIVAAAAVPFQPASAAVTIAQSPLLTQLQLDPNLILLLDDSGSMQFEFLGTQGLIDDNSLYNNYNLLYGFPLGDTAPYGTTNYWDLVPGFEADNIYAAQFRSSYVNTNYYNPATTYTPWACAGSYPESSTDNPGSYTATDYKGSNATCQWDSTVDLWVMPPATPAATMLNPTKSGSWRDLETWNNAPDATNSTSDNGYIGNNNIYDPRWLTGTSSGTPVFQYGAYQGETATTPGFWPATYFNYVGPQPATSTDLDAIGNYQRVQICPEASYSETVNLYNDASGVLNGATATITACTQPSTLPASPQPYHIYVNGSGSSAEYVYVEADGSTVVDLGTYTQQIQNFANWYQYYRSHILLAEAGVSQAFMSLPTDFRVDFALMNAMASGSAPAYSTVHSFQGTERTNFLTDFLQTPIPQDGTPSRLALAAVGNWLAETPSSAAPWGPSDAESALQGGSTSPPSCRQNYTVFVTDGAWNGSDPNVGNVDGNPGTQITGQNGQSYTYTPAPPYSDTYADTLADVAMKYWMTDLQPAMANNVPSNTSDPGFWQHMDTFTVGLGVQGTLAYPGALTGLEAGTTAWPKPCSGCLQTNIDDLWHAGIDGHGAYLNAQNPTEFASAMGQALGEISSRAGSSASLAANSTQLKTGTVAYQALYYTNTWAGNLDAFAIDPNTGAIATAPTWSAAAQMPTWKNRNVWTDNPNNSGSAKFIAFNQPSTLTGAEQVALGATPTAQQSMIDYLLGDASNEQKNGGTYRNRTTPLGDIVHSQPVYVGVPDPNTYYGMTFTGSSSYTTFVDTETTREPAIWVAANDGMLHAFDANSGAEVFAYLPAAVICPDPTATSCSSTSGISELASAGYGSGIPHQYFNDGQLTVADVYLGSHTGWQTVLVGTTGRGPAEAIYALNITNPASPTLLWERSANDGQSYSNYIGQIVGKPIIAQTADGVWSVLIGNGYNSAAGTAALLQFDIATGSLTVYPTNSATDNGLAAPAVWLGSPSNGVSTTAYAGDLDGKVWSFDLTNPGSNGTLLFTATNSAGTPQPITAGMLAGENPTTGNIWLFFGTGRYLSTADLTDTSVQTWYGIIVKAGPSEPSTLVTNLVNGRSALVQRSIIAEQEPNPSATPAVLGLRAISTPTAGDMTGKSGWYIDLVSPTLGDQGERMVTPNQFQGSLLLGTTLIPEGSDLCNPSGSGWVMAINPFTGTNPTSLFFDANGDGEFTSADEITVNGTPMAAAGLGFNSVPNNPIFVGNTMLMSFQNATTSSIKTAGTVGSISRVSWQELVNP